MAACHAGSAQTSRRKLQKDAAECPSLDALWKGQSCVFRTPGSTHTLHLPQLLANESTECKDMRKVRLLGNHPALSHGLPHAALPSHLRVVKAKTELRAGGSASASWSASGEAPKGCSASHLQMGHSGLRLDSHWSMHSRWKRCLQGSTRNFSPSLHIHPIWIRPEHDVHPVFKKHPAATGPCTLSGSGAGRAAPATSCCSCCFASPSNTQPVVAFPTRAHSLY